MKNKASLFVKHIVSVLSSIAKSKSATIRSKSSAARARLLLLAFVNKKAVLDSLSNKINRFLGHGRGSSDDEDNAIEVVDESKAIVHHAARADGACSSSMTHGAGNAADGENYSEEDDEKYPDLRHSLFDEGGSDCDDDDDDDPGRSVIDIVKDSKEGGEGFSLEDEIDHVADLFIKRFHRQVRLQKLESFKRLQAMLARSM